MSVTTREDVVRIGSIFEEMLATPAWPALHELAADLETRLAMSALRGKPEELDYHRGCADGMVSLLAAVVKMVDAVRAKPEPQPKPEQPEDFGVGAAGVGPDV